MEGDVIHFYNSWDLPHEVMCKHFHLCHCVCTQAYQIFEAYRNDIILIEDSYLYLKEHGSWRSIYTFQCSHLGVVW